VWTGFVWLTLGSVSEHGCALSRPLNGGNVLTLRASSHLLELRQDAQRGASRIVILTKLIRSRRKGYGGQVASVGGRRGEAHTAAFWWGDLGEREYLEDLGVGSRLLQWSWGSGFEGMDWINLTQGRDRWRALGNAAMTLRVS
jgi:hypothetical protein